MIVTQIRLEESADHCLLSARVRHESGDGTETDLWFRFPAALRSLLTTAADPFFVALLLPAMMLEERLVIEGDVCPRLLESSAQIQDIFASWVKGARQISVEAGRQSNPPLRPGRGTGSLFSGGVDSFHTLLKNRDTITHLLLLDRFDHKMTASDAVSRATREHAARVANDFGKELLVLQSNARLLYRSDKVKWTYYHGVVLAAMGVALGNVLHTVLIPASHTYAQLQPWGTHPLLDPLWSTHLTRIIHDGAEATRSQKVMDWICRSDLALQSLRVCPNPGDDYNCGRCEKCLRTMIQIYLAGKLGNCPVFPSTLPVEAIEGQVLTRIGLYQYTEENIALLASKPHPTALDRRLLRALENTVQRSRAKDAQREAKLARRERRQRFFQPGPVMDKLRVLVGR
jgi:hypothetical protein